MRTVPDSSPRTAIGNSMSSCASTRSESESETNLYAAEREGVWNSL